MDCDVVHFNINRKECRKFHKPEKFQTVVLSDGSIFVSSAFFTLRFTLPLLATATHDRDGDRRQRHRDDADINTVASLSTFLGTAPKFYPVVTRNDARGVVVTVTCVDWTGFSMTVYIPRHLIRRRRRQRELKVEVISRR